MFILYFIAYNRYEFIGLYHTMESALNHIIQLEQRSKEEFYIDSNELYAKITVYATYDQYAIEYIEVKD